LKKTAKIQAATLIEWIEKGVVESRQVDTKF
jgi:hypothetical protein